jgi:RsiW-degrading membrane proteinase PrsW (M82 family)
MIFKTFLFGILICLPAYFVNTYFINLLYEMYGSDEISNNAYLFLDSLIPGALVEEFLKFLVLYFFCFKSIHLDDKMDALVYGTTVSLGFAAIENVTYILNAEFYNTTWSELAWLRTFTAVPAHAAWGVIMGFFLYTFKDNKAKAITLALIIPMILHMLYNAEYFQFLFVLIFSIFLAVIFVSKAKKIQSINPWGI